LVARAIQDQLLKDFQSKSAFSDWFSRDDGPVVEVLRKPNPRNIELGEKARQLEEKIKRYVVAYFMVPNSDC
jgi:kinetochore protein Mis13/DSN1